MKFSKRQEEIIKAAMQVIAIDGIEGLTVKSIAKVIGLTEAALYRHFNSKSEIILGILSYFKERAKKLLVSVEEDKLPGLEKIHRILRTRCEDFIENPASMVVILSEDIFSQ